MIASGSVLLVRLSMTFALGLLIGCGSAPPPAASAPTEAPDRPAPAPVASTASTPSATPSAVSSVTPVAATETGAPAAPASTAHTTDVLLDTKLPPKVVTTGGSYSLAINDTVGVTRTEAMQAIEASGRSIDACFGEIFKAGGKRGKVTIAVQIDGNGHVKTTKVQLDELGDKKVPRCLEGAMKKVNWARPATKDGSSLSVDWLVQS